MAVLQPLLRRAAALGAPLLTRNSNNLMLFTVEVLTGGVEALLHLASSPHLCSTASSFD
jgi:hypothetical protein